MASEAYEQVGALLNRLEQVHATHRAARSAGNAVLDGEQQRRHVIAVDQTARDDALHTFVPALPAHNDGAAAVVRALGELFGLAGELGLDCAALLIYLLERSGEAAGLHGIAGEQQVEGERRVRHATGCVQTRDEGEGQRIGRDGGQVGPGDRRQGDVTGAGSRAHMRDTVGHEGAILGREAHHVAYRAEGGDLRIGTPELRLPQSLAQDLDEFEGHSGARELAAGALVDHFGVGHRNAHGNEIGRFVVVSHHDVDPAAGKRHHLITCGDSIVHRDDEGGLTRLDHAVERLGREAVPFLEAMGNEGVHTCAELAQGLGQQASRGDAVHVEIAEHRDDLAVAHGALHTGSHLGHTGDDKRIGPIALEGGGEEEPALLDAADPMRDHDARDQRRDAESGGEPLLEFGVVRGNAPAVRGGKRSHAIKSFVARYGGHAR